MHEVFPLRVRQNKLLRAQLFIEMEGGQKHRAICKNTVHIRVKIPDVIPLLTETLI